MAGLEGGPKLGEDTLLVLLVPVIGGGRLYCTVG